MPQPTLLRDLLPSALRQLATPARPRSERAIDHGPLTRRESSTLSHLLVRADEAARRVAADQV